MIFRRFTRIFTPKLIHRGVSQIEALPLAYSSYGDSLKSKAPLFVCHGLFGSKSNWNSLCKALERQTQRRIIAIDARNHGDSPHSDVHSYEHLVADLKHLCDTLGYDKVALLGHSMGGRTVMLFALKFPQMVERLLVADISPVTTSPNLYTTQKLIEELLKVQLPNGVNLAAARGLIDTQLSAIIEDKILRNFLLTNVIRKDDSYRWRINLTALGSNFNELARFPLVNNVTFNNPTLFIGGDDSDYIPKSDISEIVKLFPSAQLKYIEGAGHWVHSEKPTQFLEHSVKFLTE